MRIKIVTLQIKGQAVEFAENREFEHDGNKYSFLVPKVLYLEMIESIVDDKVLRDSIGVYKRVQRGSQLLYIKVDDQERKKVLDAAWVEG